MSAPALASKRKRLYLVGGVLLALLLLGFALTRFQSKTIEARLVLQHGEKMEVRIVLKPSWGFVPDRIAEFSASLDGKEMSVAEESFLGLRPMDVQRGEVIVEQRGTPEVIMWGARLGTLAEVRWRFANGGLSERSIRRGGSVETKRYQASPSGPLPTAPAMTSKDTPLPTLATQPNARTP